MDMVALRQYDEHDRAVNVIDMQPQNMSPELVNFQNRAILAEYELHMERQHTRRVYRQQLAELLSRYEGTTTGTEPLEYEHAALLRCVLGE
jgi:hypothetical protein